MVEQFLQRELDDLLKQELKPEVESKRLNTTIFFNDKGKFYIYGSNKKFLIALVGKEHFNVPRTLVSSTIVLPEEFKRALQLIYGGTSVIMLATTIKSKGLIGIVKKRELVGIEEMDIRNPLNFFLEKYSRNCLIKLRRISSNKSLQKGENTVKAVAAFLNNIHSDSLPRFQDLSAKKFEQLEKSVLREVFNAGMKTKFKFQNNRSIFIGLNIYPILLKKIKYDKVLYEGFTASIFSGLKEKLLSLAKNEAEINLINALSEDAYLYDRFAV